MKYLKTYEKAETLKNVYYFGSKQSLNRIYFVILCNTVFFSILKMKISCPYIQLNDE